MNIYDEIRAFRKIANDLLDVAIEEIDPETRVGLFASRALFASAIHTLKRGTSLSKREMLLLMKEFLSVLDERPIEIPDKDRDYYLRKNLKKKPRGDWKTQKIWQGAFAHEKRMSAQIPEADR